MSHLQSIVTKTVIDAVMVGMTQPDVLKRLIAQAFDSNAQPMTKVMIWSKTESAFEPYKYGATIPDDYMKQVCMHNDGSTWIMWKPKEP